MLAYVLAFMISIIFSYLYDITVRQIQSRNQILLRCLAALFCSLSAFPLITLSGFRGNVGVDKPLYTNEFFTLAFDTGGYVHTDFGFQLLNRFVGVFTKNPTWFYLILAAIFLIGVYKLASYFSANLSFVITLLFISYNYFESLSLIAQFTAIGIICLGIHSMLNQRWIISIVWIALACTCHLSSAIFFPIIGCYYLLCKTKYPSKLSFIISICVIIFSLFIRLFVPILISNTRYAVYLFMYDYSDLSSTSFTIINIAVLLFMLLVLASRKDVINNPDLLIFFIIQLIATCFSLAQNQINLLVRVVIYFTFFQIYSIPIYCRLIKPRMFRMITKITIIMFLLLWVFFYPISGNYYHVFPYNSVINN